MDAKSSESLRIGLAGDTMLGRGVAEAIRERGPGSVLAPEVVDAAREADVFLCNLECCISERGERWPDPRKPFFFRAPPASVEVLTALGTDCVTLANNHALDYGRQALEDTFEHLEAAGIRSVGAGRDLASARAPVVLERRGLRLGVVGATDHPSDYAADSDRSGVALADFHTPDGYRWVTDTIGDLEADIVLVTPHWGPNMTTSPLPTIRAAAPRLRSAGATLVAGHSAHVFHGVAPGILFDLGDFVDDYAVDPVLRNDLGLLWLVTVGPTGVQAIEAVPLHLDFCRTEPASGDDARWITDRLVRACAEFGTEVTERDGRLLVTGA